MSKSSTINRSINDATNEPKFNGDVFLQLILEANGLDTTDCLHNSRFAVSYMTDRTNVYCCLSADNLIAEIHDQL